jgi:hypothetical protein
MMLSATTRLCATFMEDLDVRKAAFAKGGPDGVDIVWSTVDTTASEFPGFMQNGVQARTIMQVRLVARRGRDRRATDGV